MINMCNYSRKLLKGFFQRIFTKFNFPLHLQNISYISPTSTSYVSTSSTSHTSPTSLTRSTGTWRLHICYKTPTMSFTRSSYTGLVTQEFLHRSCLQALLYIFLQRSCYRGVVAQELTSRWSNYLYLNSYKPPTSHVLYIVSYGGRGIVVVADIVLVIRCSSTSSSIYIYICIYIYIYILAN